MDKVKMHVSVFNQLPSYMRKNVRGVLLALVNNRWAEVELLKQKGAK